MFETYHNIPTSYMPKVNPIGTSKYKCPLEEYNIRGELIGYSWKHGDSIVLEFTTEGDITYTDLEFYEDAETYLKGKQMHLLIYNFRHECVYRDLQDASTIVKFYINANSSEQLVEGVYTCQLLLIDNLENVQTLVSPDDYKLIIK